MRKSGRVLAMAAMALLCCTTPAMAREKDPVSAIKGQITFLYYKDLPAAAQFYERLLGKAPEPTPEWVRLFTLTPTSTVGLVDATGGALRPSEEKPVMVTIVVDGVRGVDRWYDRVRAQGIRIAEERKTTRLDAKRSIHAFMFNDPEGYRIEILSWVRTPQS